MSEIDEQAAVQFSGGHRVSSFSLPDVLVIDLPLKHTVTIRFSQWGGGPEWTGTMDELRKLLGCEVQS